MPGLTVLGWCMMAFGVLLLAGLGVTTLWQRWRAR